jgi:hypothetical protein
MQIEKCKQKLIKFASLIALGLGWVETLNLIKMNLRHFVVMCDLYF